jgi:hypothetical protein
MSPKGRNRTFKHSGWSNKGPKNRHSRSAVMVDIMLGDALVFGYRYAV